LKNIEKKIYVKIYPKFGKEWTLFEHYGKEEQRMGLFEKSKRQANTPLEVLCKSVYLF